MGSGAATYILDIKRENTSCNSLYAGNFNAEIGGANGVVKLTDGRNKRRGELDGVRNATNKWRAGLRRQKVIAKKTKIIKIIKIIVKKLRSQINVLIKPLS